MTIDRSLAGGRAAAAHRAARAVLVDPCCEPRLAAHHIVSGWTSLAVATGLEGLEREDIVGVWPWLAGSQAALGARRVAELGRTLPALVEESERFAWDSAPFALGRAEVEAHVEALGELIARGQAGAPGRPRWLRRAAIAVGAVGIAVVAVRPALTTPPWRGTYFTRPDHSGHAVVRHDPAVDFDWGREAPLDEVPADKFSVRWDSCLHLEAPGRVVFQTISDDGSRVYVDGALVVLNRTRGQVQARGGAAQLAAGMHHVRVDYSEHSGDAQVQLLASFDDAPPGPVDGGRLTAPTGPADAADPCE